MSEHLFRKPAQQRDAAGGGADRRADPRAVGAVAVVELRRRARAQPRRAGADARAGVHHRRRRRRRRGACAPRIQPYRQPSDTRARRGRRNILRQQFRDEFGGDHPPDWQVHTTFVPAMQDAAERAVAAGLERLQPAGARGGAGRDRSGDRRHARDGRRRRLRAQHVQPRDAQPAPAGLGVQAARVCGGARARLFAGVGADEPRHVVGAAAIPNGRRATRTASSPTR